MSRRNSRFQKALRRELREAEAERAKFIQEASQESPELDGKTLRFRNRKERRAGR